MGMNFIESELLTKFPTIKPNEVQKAIKYQERFNLTLENLKCINSECSNIKKFFTTTRGYGLTCGDKNCKNITKDTRIIIKQTNSSNTCLQKYGVDHPSKIKETRTKAKDTYLKRTGYTNAAHNPEVIQKRVDTCLQQYGVKHPNMLESSKSKMREKNLEKYGSSHFKNSHISNFENWDNKQFWLDTFLDNDKRFDYIKCQNYFNCSESRTHQKIKELEIDYNRLSFISVSEKQVLDIIKKIIPESIIQENIRTIIKPYELDIYIPDHNIAIEYNGIYWHSYMSEKRSSCDKQTQLHICKQRHKQKTDACQANGIQLFHIFENEWLNPVKQEIWKSVLENALGKSKRLGARKCILKPVPKKDIRPFLEENHLQGYGNSPIAYGLYYENELSGLPELMSLMTFASGKGRMDKNTDWELIRFCNKKGYNVQGAASRLLKAFRVDHPGSIKSYANRRWSNGNLYRALGFKELGISEPNHFYWHMNNHKKLIHRQTFQKHKQEKILDNFNPNNTALQNMIVNDYAIIWDAGNYTFILD